MNTAPTVTDYARNQFAKTSAAMQKAATVSPDYRSKYNSTPDRCDCPANTKLSPCKHRRVEVMRRDLGDKIRRHAAAVTAAGGSPIQATRDVLYSTLSYYWDRENDEVIGSRFDTIMKTFVMRTIDKFEKRNGIPGSTSFLIRLSLWEGQRALGRTTLPS